MNKNNCKNSYVLITAARNEAAYIEKTIQSVIVQTILPKKWVIINDGSTDCTYEIIKRYSIKYKFIHLLNRKISENRSFSSKVYAICEGLNNLARIKYNFIGILDGDVTFNQSYYQNVITKFNEDPKLGIAGGIIYEPYGNKGNKWVRQFTSYAWSVSGAIQMFRRKCFEEIDGYLPMKKGGVDSVAEIMARMHGWEVKAFDDIIVKHHRHTGTEKGNILFARFREGIMDHSLRHHPLFAVARSVSRIRERPYVFGSLFRLAGHCWAFLRREQTNLPDEVVKFLRKEQIDRLLSFFA